MPTLTWLDRDKHIKLARETVYRLLEAVPELSAGDPHTGNMLIQGDNLEALKALLPYYAGRVKCIYIDPPYNTGSAFEHYDDALEHSKWLELIYPRLEILRAFQSLTESEGDSGLAGFVIQDAGWNGGQHGWHDLFRMIFASG